MIVIWHGTFFCYLFKDKWQGFKKTKKKETRLRVLLTVMRL